MKKYRIHEDTLKELMLSEFSEKLVEYSEDFKAYVLKPNVRLRVKEVEE